MAAPTPGAATAVPAVIRNIIIRSFFGIVSGWAAAHAQEARVPAPAHLLVPGCAAILPLDAGQAFAGPRFLVWGDRLAFFEQTAPARPGQAERPWRMTGSERLPAAPPAAGLGRARVKWRDGALWMKAGTRIYQRDATSRQWFLMADPGLEFRDFDVDLRGRILLVGTADPRTRRYRALLEAVGPDARSTEILHPYPEQDYRRWFDRISPVAAATLLTGFESVQVQEFIILFNPLARRAFIYQGVDGSLREADLGLAARTVQDLAARGGAETSGPDDLCWQVFPKSSSEAWIVHSGTAAEGLEAIALDLVEGRGQDPVPLKGCRLPVLFDPQGHLADLAGALESFSRGGAPDISVRADPETAAARSGAPPG